MDNIVANFLQVKRIDSFQKLRFLLFLHQYPDVKGTCREFAKRLHLGDLPLVENIIADLHHAGLVVRLGHHYRLFDEPTLEACLHLLAKAFEDPLARQELLDRVRSGPLAPDQ